MSPTILGPDPAGEAQGRGYRLCPLGASRELGEKKVLYSLFNRREPGAGTKSKGYKIVKALTTAPDPLRGRETVRRKRPGGKAGQGMVRDKKCSSDLW